MTIRNIQEIPSELVFEGQERKGTKGINCGPAARPSSAGGSQSVSGIREMARSPKAVRAVLEGSAYQLAFQIAQSLERTLIARAIHCAGRDSDKGGVVSVTDDHVQYALDGSLLVEACSQIGIILDGKAEVLRPKALAG